MNVSDNKKNPISEVKSISFSFTSQKEIRKQLFSLLDAKGF